MTCKEALIIRKEKHVGFIKKIQLKLHIISCDFCKMFTDNDIGLLKKRHLSLEKNIKEEKYDKLPISIGILSWKSPKKLLGTLLTYLENDLLENVNDVTILFNEASDLDIKLAQFFGIHYIAKTKNIGIGQGFLELAKVAKTDHILILENDWHLIENKNTTIKQLKSGLDLLNKGFDVVRYRSKNNPGYPHFSFGFKGRELEYYDEWHQLTSPHLLDAIHWTPLPDVKFRDQIQKEGDYYVTTSRYGNWTNNPCMFKKNFYISVIEPFTGEGIDLERRIAYWWPRQNFKVAHGDGLFKHVDIDKYGK